MGNGSTRESPASQQWLSDAVQEVIVDSGKFPLEQLSSHNEFGRGVVFICLAECGQNPAGKYHVGKKKKKVM